MLATIASMVVPHAARADVPACLNAADKGQHSRAAGKLREARQQFLLCSADGCPAMVRRDCAQWQSEVTSLTPTVVFGAKDKQGRDLFDVTVSMDGEVLVKKLDGKSVPVDPGPHTFTFELSGQPAVTERALIKEGEKTRVVTATFPVDPSGGFGSPSTTTPPPATTPAPPPPPPEERHHTVLPWVVVGIGAGGVVAGAIVLLTAPGRPSNCSATTKTCMKQPGETDAQYAADESQAGTHDSQPTAGLVIGAVGLGVAAAGLIWHFLEPTGPRDHAITVSPWAGAGSTGMLLGGSF